MSNRFSGPMTVNGGEFFEGVVQLLVSAFTPGETQMRLADCLEEVAARLRTRAAADEAAKQAAAAPKKRTRRG